MDKTSSTAAEGIQFCNQLFQIERQISEKFENCTPEQRKEYRLEHSKPVLDAFGMAKNKTPSSSPKASWERQLHIV